MTSSILERITALFQNNNYSEVVSFFSNNIEKIIDQVEKLKIYYTVSKSYYNLGRNKEAFELIQKVINSVNDMNITSKEKIEVYLDYGKILRRLGQRRKAIEIYQEIQEKFEDIFDDKLNATILHNLANVYLEIGDFTRSYDLFHQALEIDQKTKNHKGLSLSYSGLGSLNFYIGQFEEAIEYYKKSLELRRKIKDNIGIALMLLNIGSSYSNILDQKNADKHLNESLDIFQKYNHERGIQEVFITKARMNFNLHNYPRVIESLKFIEESSDCLQNEQQTELVNILIESLIRNEELVRAEKLIERCLESLENLELQKDSSLYEQFGNMKQLLSLVKFQLDKIDETLEVLEELEQISVKYNDFQSLAVVYFSKANVYYQIDSLIEAKHYAKQAKKIAKRIQHSSLPLILDILFRINTRQGDYKECTKLLKQQRRVAGRDSTELDLVIKSFLILSEKRTKPISLNLIKKMNDSQVALMLLQIMLIGIFQRSMKLTELNRYEKEIRQSVRTENSQSLYILLANILLGTENYDENFSTNNVEINTEEIFSRILLNRISEEEFQKTIHNWKDIDEVNLHQIIMGLSSIFHGIVNDLLSKESLNQKFWGKNIDEEYWDIIEITREILLNIIKCENTAEFRYKSETSMGVLVSAIFNRTLPKVFETEGITHKKQKIILGILAEFIIRTIIILFVR
jgi:tetratricopeptide (TPR) repeat protein